MLQKIIKKKKTASPCVSGLNSCKSMPFRSYLPKQFTQIQRAQYGDAMCGGRKSKKTSGTRFFYKGDCFFPTSFPIFKHFTQIYRDQYGDATLVPIRMGTNMAAGNQRKHLASTSVIKAIAFSLRGSI